MVEEKSLTRVNQYFIFLVAMEEIVGGKTNLEILEYYSFFLSVGEMKSIIFKNDQ